MVYKNRKNRSYFSAPITGFNAFVADCCVIFNASCCRSDQTGELPVLQVRQNDADDEVNSPVEAWRRQGAP